MGNSSSTNGGGLDCAQLLQKFHDTDAAYQSASNERKEHHFPRRHAALMMVLGTPPRTRDEICDVMRIALDELAKELMIPGRLPEAVSAALANCHRAIEDLALESRIGGEKRIVEVAASEPAPSEGFVELDSEIAKLDRFAGLLAYLAKNCGGKDEQPVFFALTNSAEAIRDGLSTAVDKLIPTALTAGSKATARQ
jgi:hypothetical protein